MAKVNLNDVIYDINDSAAALYNRAVRLVPYCKDGQLQRDGLEQDWMTPECIRANLDAASDAEAVALACEARTHHYFAAWILERLGAKRAGMRHRIEGLGAEVESLDLDSDDSLIA